MLEVRVGVATCEIRALPSELTPKLPLRDQRARDEAKANAAAGKSGSVPVPLTAEQKLAIEMGAVDIDVTRPYLLRKLDALSIPARQRKQIAALKKLVRASRFFDHVMMDAIRGQMMKDIGVFMGLPSRSVTVLGVCSLPSYSLIPPPLSFLSS